MTHHCDSQPSAHRIEARLVPERARVHALPRRFGRHMMLFERKVYSLMTEFVSEYRGGYWHFYDLSNGGFYMAPESDMLIVSVQENCFNGRMTADAAGITVCLFAYSLLSFASLDERFSSYFHLLREFASEHKEATMIFGAID